MTDERIARQLAYDITIAAQVFIEALGMIAENQARLHRGESPAYTELAFVDLVNRLGLHHNAVVTRWQE